MVRIVKFQQIFICVLLLFVFNEIKAQDNSTIIFESDYNTFSKRMVNNPEICKSRYSSQKGGTIVCNFLNDNMPDSLMLAVSIAAATWERYIDISENFYLDVDYKSGQSNDVVTTVLYRCNTNENVYVPRSLYRNMYPVENLDKSRDALVSINSDTEWRLGIGSNGTSNNLVLAMIQAIAQTMGYGSSLKLNPRNTVSFQITNGKTVFDNLIFSEDGIKLKDIPIRDTKQISNFAQQTCGYVYAEKKDDRYKLYAPQQFENGKSLKFSCDSTSVMYYADVSRNLAIDDITMELLSEIGWQRKYVSDVHIVCDEIDNTGIASAFSDYRFYLSTTGGATDSDCWSLSIPLNDGNVEEITSTDKIFNIKALNNIDICKRNIDGFIPCTVKYQGRQNGKEIECLYNLSLKPTPVIDRIKILEYTQNEKDPTFYNAEIEVCYRGGENCVCEIEEETNPCITNYFSKNTYYTRFFVKNVDSWGSATAYITVSNSLGNVMESIELDPSDIYSLKDVHVANVYSEKNSNEKNEYDYVEIYDITNNLIGRFTQVEKGLTVSKCNRMVLVYVKGGKVIKYEKLFR